MKLSMLLSVADDPIAATDRIRRLESAGLDHVWVPEAYAYDAFAGAAHLLGNTERLTVGTGIVNVFSRSAAAIAMASITCDRIGPGRFVLGLGASGPQVIEGLHGVGYVKPVQRIIDTIDICRMAFAGERITHDGGAVQLPFDGPGSTGLGKPLRLIARPEGEIPIWWASLMPRAVRATAQRADGWLTVFFLPERAADVWGESLVAGTTERPAALGRLDILAGGVVAIGEEYVGDRRTKVLDGLRDFYALYIGGMGARDKNFYHDVVAAYGWEREADAIQDAYLDGRRTEAASLVPDELLVQTNLVGPRSWVAERVDAYRRAGVTQLQVATAPGTDEASALDDIKEMTT